MNPITIPNISIPTIGIPTIGIPSVGFPSASGGGGLSWPAGMKEHIKAWYDPKKQGITNFDVIESYTEDFTTWRYLDSRGIATITGSTIHITEAKSIQGIVEDNKEPYSDIKILVQGVTADNPLNVRDINGTKAVIDKDGVYEFKDNGLYFGFGFSKVGVVDVTITQLPTSILKDLSGNGNHAYLYGGKGKLNSGMGVYQEDFTAWKTYNRADVDITPNILHITKVGTSNAVFISNTFLNNRNIYKLDIKGITNQSLYIGNYASANSLIKITQDGLYEIDSTKFPDSDIYGIGFIDFIGDCDITITQIPDYPNQLCYDGKMYAVCYGFPILTDYTVMADRTWFKDKLTYWGYFISKRNVFECERISVAKEETTNNFGLNNNVTIVDDRITYQNKSFYNNQIIRKGNNIDNGSPLLISGTPRSFGTENFIGCHGKIIVADRSFTENEITWLKDNWKKI